jgi:streptogramin lyase
MSGLTARAAHSALGDVTMFPLPAGASPVDVVAGSDGNLWFADQTGAIGKITVSGAVTEYPISAPFGSPFDIALGPDGNIWFTEIFGGKIGRVTPSGTVTEFSVGGEPTGITAGPDGNMWFADMLLNGVRTMTTSGTLGALFVGGLDNPREIVTGADGNLWVTDFNSAAITRISPGGSSTTFQLPPGSFFPHGITAGPDGNVWFTASGAIGNITPTGTITEFSTPSGQNPFEIASGSDGNLWFTEPAIASVARAMPTGTITEFTTPAVSLRGITPGPDGNIWFADDTGKIGRMEIAANDTTAPVISVPEPITVNATSPSGAVVTYSISATDPDDAVASLSCVPASGSTFPIGTTTVTCTASDTHGNTSSATFTIHVKGAAEQLADLLTDVTGVGPGTSLADKVRKAQSYLAVNDLRDACSTLTALINEVKAQSGETIPPDQAATLSATANRIRIVLGC